MHLRYFQALPKYQFNILSSVSVESVELNKCLLIYSLVYINMLGLGYLDRVSMHLKVNHISKGYNIQFPPPPSRKINLAEENQF